MAFLASNRARLWRYNYAILTGAGYWVIVLPVAVSQVVSLWMMAMAGDFDQTTATRIGEMMTPILGAFLAAHCLAPEYRSRVGSVLVCKPVSLHRVVTMRVALAMLAAITLTAITLGVCSVGLQPIGVMEPLLAALPSVWFLSLLALTFATLFRNAFGGFGVAAAVWALDLSVGYGIHPYLSLQGYTAVLEQDPLSELWIANKVTLVVGGALLMALHSRLLRRLAQPAERRDAVKLSAAAAAVIGVYCVSGAAATLAFAHRHRGNLKHADVVWLQRQMALYEPVPVARVFGPAFATYVDKPAAAPPAAAEGDTAAEPGTARSARVAQLEGALRRWPGSIWADGIALALARERTRVDPVQAVADYYRVAELYPKSPFAPKALAAVVRIESDEVDPAERLRATRRLVQAYPRSADIEVAAGELLERYPDEIAEAEVEQAALLAAAAGDRYRRPRWLVVAAEAQAARGDVTAARATVARAQELAKAIVAGEQQDPDPLTANVPRRTEVDRAMRDAQRLLARLDGR